MAEIPERSRPTGVLASMLFGLLFSGLVCVAMIGALAAPDTGPVLAIFPPWTDPATLIPAVTGAGGLIVGFGARDWIVSVAGPAPSLHDDLLRHGAVLLLDPRKAAALCGVTP